MNKLSEFRGRIYDSIIDTIGATPLIKLDRLPKKYDCHAIILGKCEFFNPLASVKDRIGHAMIIAAENEGKLKEGSVIVEPTSGNTGIALAFIAAAKGYRLILTMPESMSEERRKMLYLLGAEIILTPASKGMRGAIEKAQEIESNTPNAFMPQQFSNNSNPEIHCQTTAEEIWSDTGGKIDAIIAGIGTGGTFTGIGRTLKKRKPNIRMIAIEPEDSPIISGGIPGPHKIQGIGAGFIPDNLDTSLIDEVIQIGNETALITARQAARLEGLPIGISSGAALAAALEVGSRSDMLDKKIIVILPSFAERYLSTALFDGINNR